MALSYWEKIAIMIIAAVGLRIVIRLSVLIWKKLIAPSLLLGIDVTTQGKWAVVTGATDGLGKAFAKALANRGLDIVLISRSIEKLEDTAAEIKNSYGVDTRVIEADLTEGQEVYTRIGKLIDGLEVYYIKFINLTDKSYFGSIFSAKTGLAIAHLTRESGRIF